MKRNERSPVASWKRSLRPLAGAVLGAATFLAIGQLYARLGGT